MRVDAHDVVAIQGQDVALLLVGQGEIAVVFNKRRHALRHSAQQHILLEAEHGLVVQVVLQRLPLGKALADVGNEVVVAESHRKLLKIHWIHLDGTFFGRNGDVLHGLADGDERTRLDIVIATVLDQLLDGLPRLGIALHLVEDDDRLAAVERHTVFRAENHEEGIQVVQVVLKGVEHGGTHVVEVDEDIGFVLRLGELLHDGGLADTSCTFHEQGLASLGRLLPFEQFGVYLSLENHAAKISIFDNAQV